mgnify:CR=1 FL=1
MCTQYPFNNLKNLINVAGVPKKKKKNPLIGPKFLNIPQEFLLGKEMISEFFKNAYIPLLALSSLELENDCRYLNTSKCPPLAAMSKTLVHP